nr:cupin domain-containing protein [uncultured Duganella sp.]
MNHLPSLLRRCALSIPLALGALAAHGQPLPTERSGVEPKDMAAVRLPGDFDVSKGRTLRMREVTIAPGGFLPMHSHADRPSVCYVVRGTLTEYRSDRGDSRQFTAGQSYATHGAISHALQNQGEVPVVFVEVDLP